MNENIQSVIEKHKKWISDKEGGERADLRYANLGGANLRYANLRHANLSDANLSDADLSDANLGGANLGGANLGGARIYQTIGDGVVIRTMQLGKYTIVVIDDWIQIGCQGHREHQWLGFSDREITRMDLGALDWWNRNKDLVMKFLDAE